MKYAMGTWIVMWSMSICGCDEYDGPSKATITGMRLQETCKTILLAQSQSGGAPPIEAAELTRWLKQWTGANVEYIEYGSGRILDAWGRNVILVVDAGSLTALGSLGEDGIWENGSGDDIVIRIKEWSLGRTRLSKSEETIRIK